MDFQFADHAAGQGTVAPFPHDDFDALQACADPVVAQEVRHPIAIFGQMHRHDRAQLVYATAGAMELETPANRYQLAPGQAAWLPGGLDHRISGTVAPVFRSLYVRSDLAGALNSHMAIVGVSPFMAELLARLIGLYRGQGNPATYPHLVALVLSELATARPSQPTLPMPTDRRLLTICDALIAHPADRRTLAEWGLETGASCRTLERLFRRQTGMGFAVWRQLCRMLASMPRLRQGQPIQIVAWEAGYDSPSAFAATFRKIIGAAPSDFRATG